MFMDAMNQPDVQSDKSGHLTLHGTTYVVWASKIPQEGRDELTDIERPEDVLEL